MHFAICIKCKYVIASMLLRPQCVPIPKYNLLELFGVIKKKKDVNIQCEYERYNKQYEYE